MEENFKFEIISPEKIIFSSNVSMVTIPSYEGDMSILKNHISIITFLKPGIVTINKDKNNIEEFFVQDGTVEHFNDSLVLMMNFGTMNPEPYPPGPGVISDAPVPATPTGRTESASGREEESTESSGMGVINFQGIQGSRHLSEPEDPSTLPESIENPER